MHNGAGGAAMTALHTLGEHQFLVAHGHAASVD